MKSSTATCLGVGVSIMACSTCYFATKAYYLRQLDETNKELDKKSTTNKSIDERKKELARKLDGYKSCVHPERVSKLQAGSVTFATLLGALIEVESEQEEVVAKLKTDSDFKKCFDEWLKDSETK